MPLFINLYKKWFSNVTPYVKLYKTDIEQSLKKACALLVQLVERRSPKPNVGGSSPPGRALK